MFAAHQSHSAALGPGSAGPHLANAPIAPGPGIPRGYGDPVGFQLGAPQQPCAGGPPCVVDPAALAGSGNRQHTQ